MKPKKRSKSTSAKPKPKIPTPSALALAYAEARPQIDPDRAKRKRRATDIDWSHIRDDVASVFRAGKYRNTDQALVLVNVVPELARAVGRLAKFVNPGERGTTFRPVYDLWIREDWPVRVGAQGLASVEGALILDADTVPIDAECRIAGIQALWEAVFAVQGHGYQLRTERGLVGDVDGSRMLVPYRTSFADEDALITLRRARRQLARRARKARYKTWKGRSRGNV